MIATRLDQFLWDPGIPGVQSMMGPGLCNRPFIDLTDVTLADTDISILTDHANKEIPGKCGISKKLKIPNLLFAFCSDVITLFRRPRNEHGRSVASATFVAEKR